MSKQWYMTVGYPGGEFAWDGGKPLPRDAALAINKVAAEISTRPCPPDVMEWLEATTGEVCDGRQKVPGGWIVERADMSTLKSAWSSELNSSITSSSMCFVPVPGTANITVLEANDD